MLGLLWEYIYLCRALVARSLNPKGGTHFGQENRWLVCSSLTDCITMFAKQSDFAAVTVEFKSKDLSDAIEPNHAGIITPKRPWVRDLRSFMPQITDAGNELQLLLRSTHWTEELTMFKKLSQCCWHF